MRKLALLLAAALMVSAPLVATMTTDSFAAAAKKAKKAATAAPAPKDTGPQPPFQAMYNAISDIGKPSTAPAKKK
jgi:hypothetical protein